FASVQVPIIDNSIVGPNLLVSLQLTNPPSNSEAIGPQVDATLIITNVNSGVEFSASGYTQSATAGSAAIRWCGWAIPTRPSMSPPLRAPMGRRSLAS